MPDEQNTPDIFAPEFALPEFVDVTFRVKNDSDGKGNILFLFTFSDTVTEVTHLKTGEKIGEISGGIGNFTIKVGPRNFSISHAAAWGAFNRALEKLMPPDSA